MTKEIFYVQVTQHLLGKTSVRKTEGEKPQEEKLTQQMMRLCSRLDEQSFLEEVNLNVNG